MFAKVNKLYNAYYLFDCMSIHTAIPEGMLQSDQQLLLEKAREIDKLKSDLHEKKSMILPTKAVYAYNMSTCTFTLLLLIEIESRQLLQLRMSRMRVMELEAKHKAMEGTFKLKTLLKSILFQILKRN